MAGNPSASAVRSLITKVQESYAAATAQQRPWNELIDRSSLAKPESLNDALSRIRKNLGYFRANYLGILIAVVVLSMLWNPTAILWLGLLGSGWVYVFMVRTEPIIVAGRTLNEREKFLGMVVISVVVVFGLTSVGSILMSGVVIGAVAITVHASFRVPDDLFLDDSDSAGFLSFLGGRPQMPPAL
ncbi:unnamed protein product [Closterium sp. Yama58-4]|nr:unnamed protein product [Closterium sp. Yama58-4]